MTNGRGGVQPEGTTEMMKRSKFGRPQSKKIQLPRSYVYSKVFVRYGVPSRFIRQKRTVQQYSATVIK